MHLRPSEASRAGQQLTVLVTEQEHHIRTHRNAAWLSLPSPFPAPFTPLSPQLRHREPPWQHLCEETQPAMPRSSAYQLQSDLT